MRELTACELHIVSGGHGVCTAEDSGNDLGGIKDSEGIGQDLINIYEGAVAAVSHVIERVANAL
ncbi:MAG: hypothetical protein HKN64_04880 [Woeseiaceae bacterium]|nr:hypothetical protein [Woeseiaceae bacterium]